MNKLTMSLAAGVGFLAVAGLWGLQRPEAPMGHSMTPPDTSAVAEGAPLAKVAVPASLSKAAQIGERVFEAKCASCHGGNAAGQNGIAPPLVHEIYEPGHHSDTAFVLAAKNGVRAHHWNFGNMPPVDGVTDADVKYVAQYVRELQRENGIF